MEASENKRIMQEVFAGLSTGNTSIFFERMADDIRWVITGTTKLSRTFEGKDAVLTGLLMPLRELFGDRLTLTAHRFIAEDDFVVVESHGNGTTNDGRAYNNTYCWVNRLADGKITEIVEYLDTQLVASVFEA